jgi:predicted DNA-binding transcriptional regulator AlpA
MSRAATISRITPVPRPTSRGVNREEAADYIGVSASLFDEMVRDGRMPKPKRINSRTVWDVRALDRCFDALPGEGGSEDAWDVAV